MTILGIIAFQRVLSLGLIASQRPIKNLRGEGLNFQRLPAGLPDMPTLLVTHGGWLTVVLSHYGHPRTPDALFAPKSPDLFSLTPTGAT